MPTGAGRPKPGLLSANTGLKMAENGEKTTERAAGLAVSLLIAAGGAWLFYLLTYRIGGTTATRQAWALAGGLVRLVIAVVLIGLVGVVVHMLVLPRRICPFCGATWWGRHRDCPYCEGGPAGAGAPDAECDTIHEMDSDPSTAIGQRKGEQDES